MLRSQSSQSVNVGMNDENIIQNYFYTRWRWSRSRTFTPALAPTKMSRLRLRNTVSHRTLFHLLSPIFCFLSPLSYLPTPVCCLPSPDCRLLSPASCLSSPVNRLMSAVSCIPSPVSRLLSPIYCLLSHVSCAVSDADLIVNDLADLAVLWSKLATWAI